MMGATAADTVTIAACMQLSSIALNIHQMLACRSLPEDEGHTTKPHNAPLQNLVVLLAE